MRGEERSGEEWRVNAKERGNKGYSNEKNKRGTRGEKQESGRKRRRKGEKRRREGGASRLKQAHIYLVVGQPVNETVGGKRGID